MRDEDWSSFLANGKPAVLGIARLHPELCRTLGTSTDLVSLRHDYALKIARKHGLEPRDFALLPVTIALGRAVCDRERHLTFFHYDAVSFESWFQASIKRNIAGDEIWVATFHRQRAREVERQCMRYGVLWP